MAQVTQKVAEDAGAETALSEIVIADDSSVDYEITVRSLRKAGFAQPFVHCRDGRDVLAYLDGAARCPALILLDLNMPGMDGRQTLDRLKADDRTRRIPVLMLTTSGNRLDVMHCYAHGANAYLRKPNTPDEFVRMAEALHAFWLDWTALPAAGAGCPHMLQAEYPPLA